jgi:hypothetical protein
MTTIHNVTIILLTSFLLSFSCWADEQQAATDSTATTAPVAAAAETPPSPPAEAVAPAPVVADTDTVLRDDHPDQYLVVKGDTLWEIANRFLKNPWMWPEVWHVNPQIANPHLIYPGDTIKLIYLEGQARLTVKRGEAGVTYKMSPEAADESVNKVSGNADTTLATQSTGAANTVSADQKLHPSVRVMPLQEPIPAIPLNIINPFLSGARVVEPGALDGAPYVVQGSQHHVVTGAGAELYVRGKLDPNHAVYNLFRKGKTYVDPDTNELLGVQAIDIGTGKVKAQDKNIARLSIVRSTQEVRVGDRLLVNQERRVESTFFPSAPEADIQGKIIDVEGGVTQVGAMSVVAINKGERDQLQSGNVLAIYERGEVVRDTIANDHVQLMDERAGLAMVFVTFEKMSYALVLYADRPLHVGDVAKKP